MQITKLQDEGVIEEMVAPVVNTNVEQKLVSAATRENRSHTINDFLNRFHVLEQFTWSATDTRGKVLKTYRFPDVLNSVMSIRNKQLNFYGLRAGVELIAQVNSQPFQAGALMISFLPNARYNNVKRETHEKDLQGMVSRSGAPRTTLDLMDVTRASLKVPYASPFVFYNLLTNEGNIGDFHISVYAPLRDVAAAGTVTVTVAARFTDVELAFPTGSALPANSDNLITNIAHHLERLSIDPSRPKVAKVRRAATELIKKIDAGEVVLQMNTGVSAFKQKAVPNMATATDDDMTHMLSTSSSNSLKPLNMGNASGNEMDFNHILAIPCYHNFFSVGTNQVSGTNVWSSTVEPLKETDIVNTDTSMSVDYMYALSNMFRKWRGGIVYKFRVIKTRYHSLRLRISFAPGATSQANIDRDSCYSAIYDLRDSNTMEFVVPYVHPFPWLNTKSQGTTPDTSLGLIMVDVHNQMVAPSTVSSSVDVIVERHAHVDFKLGVPTSLRAFPFDPMPAQEEKSIPWYRQTVRPEPISPEHNPRPLVPTEPSTTTTTQSGDTVIQIDPPSEDDCTVDDTCPFEVVADEIQPPRRRGGRREFQGNCVMKSYESAGEDSRTRLNRTTRMKFQGNSGPWWMLPLTWAATVFTSMAICIIGDKIGGWIRDLTTEGVEPNPGPIRTSRTLISGTQSVNFTSTFAGPQEIEIEVGVVPQQNIIDSFDCTVTSNVSNPQQISILPRCYTGAPFRTKFMWTDRTIPIITFTGQSSGSHQNYILISFKTEVGMSFQMNSFEQDGERMMPGCDSITQPKIVETMGQYCLGNEVTNVRDMIRRSTYFSNVTPLDSRPIHIMTHAFGTAARTAQGVNKADGLDNLSYLAHFYAFSRGGVNFRLQTNGSTYRVIVNTNNDYNVVSTNQFYDLVEQLGDANSTTLDQVRASNLMQHIVNPSVEGIGEVAIPFYSSSYCQGINPELSVRPVVDVANFTIPDTHMVVEPAGLLSEMYVFRNAGADFQFSYLTGPPLLLSF
ncbi:hypothetical protein 2 [Beihai picorna-like virus 75]|uniref:hypothetical protein 2 n=1 Tax=Beihai picorna-like virus 75 TaxID=1922622 RepID=UPI000909D47C|nr:hypothetical protein 2 [Beihai picorna-like virus 75]APG76814.1 hypothetical protein 2 [Beihai picorna-like virus 75]